MWPSRGGARRNGLQAALITIRPHQWIKNALVIAAAGAAGALGRDDVPGRIGLACVAFCLLMVTGLLACAFIRPLLAAVGAGYLLVTLSYTVLWRWVLILDVIAIAGGFVLRTIAGGVAAPVTLSRWFVLVVSCSAVFVAAGKRRADLERTANTHDEGRRVLALYGERRLAWVLADRRLQVAALGRLVLFALGVNAGG